MLYVICGKACSGKDTIVNELIRSNVVKKIVSHTTRPMREGEVDSVTYHYHDEYNEESSLCSRHFNVASGDTWHYWFDNDEIMYSIASDDNYVCIADPSGCEILRKLGAYVIYISVDNMELLERYYEREKKEESPKFEEVIRRVIADSYDFKEMKSNQNYDFIVHNGNNCLIYNSIGSVKNYIKHHSRNIVCRRVSKRLRESSES